MKTGISDLLVAACALSMLAACSSSAGNGGAGSDAGPGNADAGNTPSGEDAGGTTPADSGGDANAGTGPGGCLTGGDSTTCTSPGQTSGVGACIGGDFCTSLAGLNTQVAASVLACETQDLTAPGCTKIDSCVHTALALACPDPTTSTPCASVVGACADAGTGAVTEAACEQILAGFNVTTRTVFAQCWMGSCNADTCIGNLFVP